MLCKRVSVFFLSLILLASFDFYIQFKSGREEKQNATHFGDMFFCELEMVDLVPFKKFITNAQRANKIRITMVLSAVFFFGKKMKREIKMC